MALRVNNSFRIMQKKIITKNSLFSCWGVNKKKSLQFTFLLPKQIKLFSGWSCQLESWGIFSPSLALASLMWSLNVFFPSVALDSLLWRTGMNIFTPSPTLASLLWRPGICSRYNWPWFPYHEELRYVLSMTCHSSPHSKG